VFITATGAPYSVQLLFTSTASLDSLTINSADATLGMLIGTLNVTGSGSGATDTLAVDAGTVDMANGSTITATNITLGTGGILEGNGIVTGALSGSGIVQASSGGILKLETAIGSSTGLQFEISNAGNNTLEVDASIGAGNTFTFFPFSPSSPQAFAYNSAPAITVNIVGLDVGSSATASTNVVDFMQHTVTVTSGGEGSGTGGTVTLSDGSILTLSGITDSSLGPHWFVETAADGVGGTEVFLAVCYVAGTRILTATGERAIENLLQGDIVLTLSDGELKAQPVKWLGHRRIGLTGHGRPETVAPIRIQRDAFADGMPHRDLLVSPDHAIFVDGKLICARQLVNGTTIRQELDWTAVDYYHVELDQHAILLAEGLPAESYIDTGNSGFFANSGARLVLHPDLTDEADYPTREVGSCAPFVWDEASVRPVWQRLADRAGPVSQRVTTTDADLRVIADQRPVKSVFSDDDRVICVLPRGAHEVRLVSRAQSPTEARPWLEDRRQLGVRVKRIVLRGADDLREVPVDHPDLTRGWWAVERDGQVMSRWTDGKAVLPLPAMRGPVTLEVQLAGTMIFAVNAAKDGTERRAAA
jgi:hypothetical protein